MNEKEGEFLGREQTPLKYLIWEPSEGNIKAEIIAFHDWWTTSKKFEAFAEYITDKGYRLYGMDLRGHGKNTLGHKGHIESMETLIKDIVLFMDSIKNKEKEKKIFLLGNSFGGLVALRYAIAHPLLDGVIAVSPLLDLKIKIPGAKKLAKKLKRNPAAMISYEIDQKFLTSDLKILKQYLADKDRLKSISVKSYSDMQDAMKEVLSGASGLLCSVFILQAGNEKIVNKSKVKKFYEKIKSEDKNYKEYDLFLHDLMAEKMRAQVFQDIYIWLEKHL